MNEIDNAKEVFLTMLEKSDPIKNTDYWLYATPHGYLLLNENDYAIIMDSSGAPIIFPDSGSAIFQAYRWTVCK